VSEREMSLEDDLVYCSVYIFWKAFLILYKKINVNAMQAISDVRVVWGWGWRESDKSGE
jgi:hypothetical protein